MGEKFIECPQGLNHEQGRVLYTINILMWGVFNCLNELNYRQHLYSDNSVLQVTCSCFFSEHSVAVMD